MHHVRCMVIKFVLPFRGMTNEQRTANLIEMKKKRILFIGADKYLRAAN